MGILETLAGILGVSLGSGINLYMTVLLVGLGQRYGLISGLPDDLAILSHPIVLGIAGGMYLLEFAADKIPGFTPIWDGFHTFIRPLGATVLALGVAADLDPMVKAIAAIAAGSIALGSHSTKAGARLMAHTVPEPTTHSAMSLAEDAGVAGLLWLAFSFPIVAIIVSVVLIGFMIFLAPIILRTISFLLACVGGYLRRLRGGGDEPYIPVWLEKELSRTPSNDLPWLTPAYARSGVQTARLRPGFLLVDGTKARFVWRAWGRTRSQDVATEIAHEAVLETRILCDLLVVERGSSPITICLTKDRARRFSKQFGFARDRRTNQEAPA